MLKPANADRRYIQRLRSDPRTRALFNGWAAQATLEADQRFPDPHDGRLAACFAAERAIELAMSFVLDNDGEYQMVSDELNQLRNRVIEGFMMPPAVVVMQRAPVADTETADGR